VVVALHTSTELFYLKPDWYYDRWPFACIPYWYETSHPGKLSLLPSVGWEMSIGQSVMMLCGWGVKAGMTHSTCGLSTWVAGKTALSLVNMCSIWAPSLCVWYTHTLLWKHTGFHLQAGTSEMMTFWCVCACDSSCVPGVPAGHQWDSAAGETDESDDGQ